MPGTGTKRFAWGTLEPKRLKMARRGEPADEAHRLLELSSEDERQDAQLRVPNSPSNPSSECASGGSSPKAQASSGEHSGEDAVVPATRRAERRRGKSPRRLVKEEEEEVKKKRVEKKCRICKRSAYSKDPRDPDNYILWGRGQKRPIANVDAGDDSGLYGRIDYYCKKTHESVAEYKSLKTCELQARVQASQEATSTFEGWRIGVIVQLTDNARIVKATLTKQDVNKYDDAFARRFKTGRDVTVERFHELAKKRPDLRKRAKILEAQTRDGPLEFVRIYDQPAGEFRFEEGGEERVRLRTSLDDGSVLVDARQQLTAYNDASKTLFGSYDKKNVLLDSDVFTQAGLASSSVRPKFEPAPEKQKLACAVGEEDYADNGCCCCCCCCCCC